MAEEPSAKRPHGEKPDYTTNLDDVEVPGEKLDYTTKHNDIEVHGKEPLHVVCTSNLDETDEMILNLRKRAGSLFERIIGVDVEFTKNDDPQQRAAVLQLCMEDQCRVYHITAAKEKWTNPYPGKEYDSLAAVASNVIHPFYTDMKKKINREEDHNLRGISPLLGKLIKYAATDAYATYESWKKIITIIKGLDKAKEEEDFGNPYAHYGF